MELLYLSQLDTYLLNQSDREMKISTYEDTEACSLLQKLLGRGTWTNRNGEEGEVRRRAEGGGAVTAAAASAPTCQPGLQREHSAIFPLGSMILNSSSSAFAQVVVRPLS